MSNKKIKVVENGPYIVSGDIPLSRENSVPGEDGIPEKWKKAGEVTAGKQYFLCRCGNSKNKPFCDQSHLTEGFDGAETAENIPFDLQAETYDGPELVMQDATSFCAGARFCDRGDRAWTLIEESADPVAKKMAIEEACNCPAGRLVVKDKKTGEIIEPKFEKSISVTEDIGAKVGGPLWVKGGIPVESSEGKEYEVRNRVTLCRCGKSSNKPFCDSSHISAGFKDENVKKQ